MSDIVDCKTCGERKQKYQECAGKPWFSVGDIRWCPSQVLWMLENFFELTKDGIVRLELDWPSNPDDSKEIDLPSVQRPRASSAYFTKPAEVIGELAVRLTRVGHSGELLLAELQAGMEGNLTDEAKAAFYYITGFYRKEDSYPHWKANRKWYRKGKNTQIPQKLDKFTR